MPMLMDIVIEDLEQGTLESDSDIRYGPLSAILWRFGLALASVGGTVWLILAVGWSLHLLWLLLLGPLSLVFLWRAAEMVRDLIAGSVELVGTVTGTSAAVVDECAIYSLYVQGRAFSVTMDIYNWVSEGEEVAVKFWPRTKIVDTVRKLPIP